MGTPARQLENLLGVALRADWLAAAQARHPSTNRDLLLTEFLWADISASTSAGCLPQGWEVRGRGVVGSGGRGGSR